MSFTVSRTPCKVSTSRITTEYYLSWDAMAMGKTTTCQAIMGLVPVSSGSISVDGENLVGKGPAEIARLGVGYVPQGRRLWQSLTVDEHLKLVARKSGLWSPERIYSFFPRLAERKNNGGGQLSGGEQQMLAISRALLLNPKLLIMDETHRRLGTRHRISGCRYADQAR